jgi:hypothetical protein
MKKNTCLSTWVSPKQSPFRQYEIRLDQLPPEAFKDPKCMNMLPDVYSLGANLFRVVSGRLPFEGEVPM